MRRTAPAGVSLPSAATPPFPLYSLFLPPLPPSLFPTSSLSPAGIGSLRWIELSAPAVALCLQVAATAGDPRRRAHTPWIRRDPLHVHF